MLPHTCTSKGRLLFIAILLLFPLSIVLTGTGFAQNDWSAWKYRMPITLTNRSAESAGLVPVDVTFSLFADQCKNPEKEIRLTLKTPGGEREVPFQLSNLSRWTKDTDGQRSLPTVNGMITFFDEAPGDGDAEYVLLYGNPNARTPSFPTDITVSGTKPAWSIDNSVMTVELRGKRTGLPESTNHDSGQLAQVILKKRPETPVTTESGIVHWNPGIFVPTRGWIHSTAWDPPEVCEIEQGPLYVKVKRSGIFPGIPEAKLSITYRIFTGRSYVESGTVIEILDDIGVVALRNDELIFEQGFFSQVGWDRNGVSMVRRLGEFTPVNKHGDILRLRDDTPYITLFSPERGIGAATVRAELAAVGPGGAPPTLFDNATYVANGELQYWFRPQVYFHVGWDRKQLITVPKGSVYSERNLYYFYEPDSSDAIRPVRSLSWAVRSQPTINIGSGPLPPEK